MRSSVLRVLRRPSPRARWFWTFLAVTSLTVPACGTTGTATEQASNTELLVDTASGGQLDWGTLEGRDVVLWFWAPW